MFSKELLKQKMMATPKYRDVFILALFAILITLNPYFMHGKINIFEAGIYLPGIQALLNGEVPYRDFFHLRGPFELYMPTLLMKIFGMHIKVMYSYFYFGNVLCLILCVLIAKEILKTRYMLYLMTPVLIGRAWPRVVFTYWGGMRYALGLLAVWFIIKFFKKNKPIWLFGAGMVSVVASLTSIEMGIYAFLGLCVSLGVSMILKLQDYKLIFKSLTLYVIGACVILIPYGIYLVVNSALLPYLDSVWTIVTRMQKVIDPHFVSVYPRNLIEAIAAMINPNHTNFKHMTPSYLYIFILIYLIMCLRKRMFLREHLMILCLGVYGFIMYNTGFRGIWAAQFEMALQPEKVLYFFLLEVFLLNVIQKRKSLIPSLEKRASVKWHDKDKLKLYGMNAFMFILLCSSVGYSIQRYNHRFFAFKYMRDKIAGKDTAHLIPGENSGTKTLAIERAKGILVPNDQAEELAQIQKFVETYINKDEVFYTYPDLGTYNYLVNRRFFSNYPLSTFGWFNDRWHEQFVEELNVSKPRYVVLQKEIPQYWKDVYLALEPNRKKHRDVMDFIANNYTIETETVLSTIYRLK